MASPGDPQRPADSTIDLTTLFLSAIASAAAAYITSKLWGPGTLFSAAFAPVIVALVKEGLRRPTEKVANVVPAVVTPTRWSRGAADDPGLVAAPDPAAPPAPDVHRDPDAPHVVLPGPVRVYSTRARRLRWRLALITGLLGFGVCVLVFTVPELIAGQSVGGSHKTTIFGGHRSKHTKKSTTSTTSTSTTKTSTTETTPTTKTTTVTKTVTTPTTTTETPTTATPAPSATQAPSTAVPPTAEQPATTTP